MDEELRAPLLALHKAVLTVERQNVERVHGAMSAAEFLQLVSDPLRYGWLKPLTELVLAAEADEDDEDAPTPEELRDRARDLLLPRLLSGQVELNTKDLSARATKPSRNSA